MQPSTLDPSLDPDALRPQALATLAFVWLYILAYMWRGLFKAGFPSAVLMIVAIVLCATLAAVSFFVGTDGGTHVASAISATFDWRPLVHGIFDSAYSVSLVRYMCQDLCLGCCILGTITSYTKIGFNTYPSGVFTCIVEFIMAFVPFVSLLAIVGNLQAVTNIPLADIIRKTGNAPAYFVVFPAAFEKVSSPHLFGLFFYGGVFLINTQVAAIGIHSVFNAFLESRLINHRWRRLTSTAIVVACYCLSLPLCSNNQQIRMEYILYILEWMLVPASVFCTTFYVGWIMDFNRQAQIVGLRASVLFSGLCFIAGLVYVTLVFCGRGSIFLPNWIMVFVNALLAVLVATLIKDPEGQAQTFTDRFLALYLGGVRELGKEVTRVTLFFPSHSRVGSSVFGILPTIFCGCLTRPIFMYRPSTFWCICIKHLVPFVMIVALIDACTHFEDMWESIARSPNMRNCGGAILGLAAAFIILTPLTPKIRDWVRPVTEDYMPTTLFPTHPFVAWRRTSIFALIPQLFEEHLPRSKDPSPALKSVLLDYKKHQLRQAPSFAPEDILAQSETEIDRQVRHLPEPHATPSAPRPPSSQPVSLFSRSSEGRKPRGIETAPSEVRSLRDK